MHFFPISFIFILLPMLLLPWGSAYARDIDIDSIYINKKSQGYSNLLKLKKKLLATVLADEISKDVAFLGWVDSENIYLIKEYGSRSYLYNYNILSKKNKLIKKLNVVVTIVEHDGNYILVKGFNLGSISSPFPVTQLINLKTRQSWEINSKNPFTDMSFSGQSNGELVIFRNNKVSIKNYLGGEVKTIMGKSKFSKVIRKGDKVVAYISPNEKGVALIVGKGGRYRLLLFVSGHQIFSDVVSSISEFAWIGNKNIVYQKGYALNYKIFRYDVVRKKRFNILNQSINTNISVVKNKLIYLKNQMVNIYDFDLDKVAQLGIDLGDPSISLDGEKIIGLIGDRAYMVNMLNIKQRWVLLHRVWSEIFKEYLSILKNINFHENKFTSKYIRIRLGLCREYLN